MCNLVSIIIPNYNHASYLEERINSVLNQTYQDFEIILLDDASTDTSVELLNSYKEHPKVSHLVVNKNNSGSPFKQWQRGIDLAKGDLIWIAESDDYCEPNFLESCIKTFKENKDVGIVYTQSADVNGDGKKIFDRLKYTKQFKKNIWDSDFKMEGKDFIKSYLSVKNVIPNASAVVFKKELIQPTDFSTNLVEMQMCGDWFFWIQLLLKSNIAYVSRELNYFRSHKESSRTHNSIEKKIKRLVEESTIRKYLQGYKLNNLDATKLMYNKWFSLHSIIKLFSSELSSIKVNNVSKFIFNLQFVIFKLKKKWL